MWRLSLPLHPPTLKTKQTPCLIFIWSLSQLWTKKTLNQRKHQNLLQLTVTIHNAIIQCWNSWSRLSWRLRYIRTFMYFVLTILPIDSASISGTVFLSLSTCLVTRRSQTSLKVHHSHLRGMVLFLKSTWKLLLFLFTRNCERETVSSFLTSFYLVQLHVVLVYFLWKKVEIFR